MMMSNLNFLIILFIGFIDYLGIALVYPIFTIMLFDPTCPIIPESSSPAYRGFILGILIGLTPLMQFFSSPLLGAISDCKGRKKTLILGTFLGFLGYGFALVALLINSLSLLFLYRILVGIASGTTPVAQAAISDTSTKENKARRFSFFNASLGLGFTIGPFLGGTLADPTLTSWTGYLTPFMAACLMSLIGLIVIIRKFPETRKESTHLTFNVMSSIQNIGKVFLWPQLRWLFFATFAFAFGWSFFNEFIPLLLRHKFTFTLNDIGNYYAYGGAWYALSSALITTTMLKYFSPEKIGIKALIGCSLSMSVYLIIEDPNYIWFIVPLLMICLSLTFPTTAVMVSNRVDVNHQGEVLGIYQSVIGGAMGLSPFLMGPFIGIYPSLTVVGGFFIMLLAGFFFRKGSQMSIPKLRPKHNDL